MRPCAFGLGTKTRGATALAAAALLSACGGSRHEGARTSAAGAGTGAADEPFAAWCADWGLTCPTGPAPGVPSAANPWSPQQWKDLLGIVKAVGESATDIQIQRAELDDPNLQKIAHQFGVDGMLAKLKDRIDAVHGTTLTVQGGAVTLAAPAAATFTGPSGLMTETAPTIAFSATERDDLQATGVTLAGKTGGSPFDTATVTDPNVLTWRGPSMGVTGVPIEFLAQEVLGIDVTQIPTTFPAFADMVPAMGPLGAWLTTGQRDIDLATGQLQQLGAQVPSVFPDPGLGQAFGYILARLTSVKSTAASRQNGLIQGTASEEIQCDAGGQATMTIETGFGIDSMTTLDDGGVRLEVHGIKAQPDSGLIRPTISLAKMDLEPTSVTIYNVPILGTYTVDMSKQGDLSLTCGQP